MTAENGKLALEVYVRNRGKIAAVICDMMMPVMDGPQLIRSLKKSDPSLPVLAMSGLIEDKADEAKNAGASCLLQKPFSTEALLKTLALFVRKTPP
jgi:CheY-like chemotaxis protein